MNGTVDPHGKLSSNILRAYFNGPDHPAKLRIWSRLRHLTGYRRLTIPYADGGYLTVDERDFLQRIILLEGSYEPEVWECLAAAATGNEVFWDIGAHIGTMSARAVRNGKFCEVHAFEPDSRQADVLRTNLALNGRKWDVHNVALSDEIASRTFHRAVGSNSGISSLRPFSSGQAIKVRCTTMDHLIFAMGLKPPTLLKIDVEGWELAVFRGGLQTMEKYPPRLIVFESEANSQGGLVSTEIPKYLNRLNYQIRRIARPSGVIDGNENYCAELRRDRTAG